MTRPMRDSRSQAQQARRHVKSPAQLLPGFISSDDGAGNLTVNIGGIDQAGISLCNEALKVGDNVEVLRQSDFYYVIGLVNATVRPSAGIVAATPTDSAVVSVTTEVGDIDCGWCDGYSPTAADPVWIVWLGSTPVVLGKQGTTGTPPTPSPSPTPPPPTPPPPKITTGTASFAATDCGTFRAGSGWLADSISAGNVMAGEFGSFGLNDGAWFYAGRVRATLAGATVTAAQIYLGRSQGGVYAAQTVHLYRVTNDRQPGGDLTFDATHTHDVALAVGQKGWFAIPNSFAQALVDSGGSIGIKAPAGPYVRMFGLAQSGGAGQLKISWRRSG